MALTADFNSRVIDSSTSITDIVEFHRSLRALEASSAGMLYPIVHTFKAVDLGGGASFYAVDFVNGWRLRFPLTGNYAIVGNINADIVASAGVFIERTKALAFATSNAGGGGAGTGLTAAQVAAAVLDAPASEYNEPGTIGRILNRVLTLAGFLTYKDQ